MHEVAICIALLARVLHVAALEGGKQASNITVCTDAPVLQASARSGAALWLDWLVSVLNTQSHPGARQAALHG
jgi:hypothetical protein